MFYCIRFVQRDHSPDGTTEAVRQPLIDWSGYAVKYFTHLSRIRGFEQGNIPIHYVAVSL